MYTFLVLIILAVSPYICKGQHENACDVFPKDQYLEVGSDINIVCQTSCIQGKIFWTLNNRRVKESLSNTTNSTHTVLSLRNFTHHSATLECHSAATQQVLGGTTIRTYSKPGKISCLLKNRNQELEVSPDLFICKWEHQINSSLKIEYIVLRGSSQSEICSSYTTTCTVNITLGSNTRILYEMLNITVRAKTTAWQADSDPYIRNPEHILQIIRPTINVTPSSDDLLVKWKRSLFTSECHCQVNYSKAVSGRTPESVMINKTVEKHSSGTVTITKVESCSNYTFSVRCALPKAPWSDWSKEKTVLTKLNKSDVKLHLWRKVAEPQENGVRRVHVMWKEVPSTCEETFTYVIKQTPYKEQKMGVNQCGRSPCDVYVSQDAHRISLNLFNKDALFMEESVYVPAVGESLPQVTDIQTSTYEGVILVSWEALTHPVSGYMIDWTHDGNQYHWEESKYTNTTLSDLLDKTPYNITVTPLFDDKTGHATQALQICSSVGDPGNVTMNVTAYDKSAFVSWSVTSQEICSGVVVNYTVFYSTQKGPQLNVTVDGTKQDIFLKDLNPDTRYTIYVTATALTGTTNSSETHFKTQKFGPGLIAAVSMCGSIIILLVLSLGLYCAVQWEKFREKPVPDPGRSSVALLLSPSHQEGIYTFPPFSNPPESVCDKVYTEETQTIATSPQATGSNETPASVQTEEYVDPATVPVLHIQNKDPVEAVETQHLSSPDDSTALLPSETSPVSPYRSQTPVHSPTSKELKQVPPKQPEKTMPMTVYVTLNMFEQGQAR